MLALGEAFIGDEEITTILQDEGPPQIHPDGIVHQPPEHAQLITQHCTDSNSKTLHGEQWVTAEVEVHGHGRIIHRINGETVLEYEQSQLDAGHRDAKKLIKDGKVALHAGHIALQSESHPIEFRKVEIRPLAP